MLYDKEGCEHGGDWLLEECIILPSVVVGADDSDHEIGKVILWRLIQKNSRSGNKKNCSKKKHEKPAKKKARKQVKEKLAKTRARNEVGSQNTTSVITHTIDESNYKMISDANNHDQQCISSIDGSTMPTNYSDRDYVPISLVSEGGESLLKDEDFLF
ncbi:NAC transcription factor 29-like [Pyrus ussuriensis x Pyrus communis]|uniref:NAC transcription factor 29-like n=1 Tax=Pyrus ussuriensis x Pyrus communis TaxID=2448454 RepID=A0A5N5GP55_9ROSA|nr:NAC transcription factor 29-like [Pyrus ussuriensis x Pyrus communis]